MMKGRFFLLAPLRTDELKIADVSAVQRPILSWTDDDFVAGRQIESIARRDLPMWQRMNPSYSMPKSVKALEANWRALAYRPLINWKTQRFSTSHEACVEPAR